MKKIFSIHLGLVSIMISMLCFPATSFSQSGWDSFDIDFSGCAAEFPYEPEWDFSLSEDSSLVWVGEVDEDNIFYGLICIEFSEPFDYDYEQQDLIDITESYLDYLQSTFNIVSHSGYVTGYTLDSNPLATGIADSWQDNEGDPWIVRAWVDPYNLVVMYIYGSPDSDLEANKDEFFNSLSFP